MHYAPIGVFGLMAYTVTKHGLAVLLPLGKVILLMYAGCAILYCFMFLPLVKFVVKIPVMRFVKGMLEPFMIGFTTCSSAAALPSNMRCTEALGASRTVVSFGIPLGNTINMNGTALYMGINTIFVAEFYGISLPLDAQLTVILMSILAAVGTMGVPGAGLIMMSIVFVQMGMPWKAWPDRGHRPRSRHGPHAHERAGRQLGALVVSRLEGDFNDNPEPVPQAREQAQGRHSAPARNAKIRKRAASARWMPPFCNSPLFFHLGSSSHQRGKTGHGVPGRGQGDDFADFGREQAVRLPFGRRHGTPERIIPGMKGNGKLAHMGGQQGFGLQVTGRTGRLLGRHVNIRPVGVVLAAVQHDQVKTAEGLPMARSACRNRCRR